MAGKRTGENWLSARGVASAKTGDHADGGGLYLQVTGTARSWIYRYQIARRRREMGLGSALAVSLAEARQKRDQCRRQVAAGIDPLTARAAPVTVRTWGQAVDQYIDRNKAEWKSSRGGKMVERDGVLMGVQENQWRQSLTDYGPARDLPVTAIDTQTVLDCLTPLWKPRDKGGKTETATRIRGRIERVWDAERVARHVTGENPARWKGHLEALLPKPGKLKQKRHFPALPYERAPEMYTALQGRTTPAAKALLFTLLTAARTGEVRLMPNLSEIDFDSKTWRIPAGRMKAERAHDVPLVTEAIAILEMLPRSKRPFPLSENGMLQLVQGDPPYGLGLPYTVHGLRSTFREWAAEKTDVPREIAEMSIAHKAKGETEAAYQRRTLLPKRRELMECWVAYLSGKEPPTKNKKRGGRAVRKAKADNNPG